MKRVEIGTIFERDNKIFGVIGTTKERIIISRPIGEPKCNHCGNRFIKYDVEVSKDFQDNIKAVKTIEKTVYN